MTRRRTEITVETERVVVVHAQRTTRVFCAHCGMEVETVACTNEDQPNNCAPGDARETEQPEDDSHKL